MTKPIQVTFRNMDASPALEEDIRLRVEWLESFHPDIMGCQVLVEMPHRHRRKNRPLHVRISVPVPGGQVVVNHEPGVRGLLKGLDASKVHKATEIDGAHTNPYVAVHDAFDLARRQLDVFARRQRGD